MPQLCTRTTTSPGAGVGRGESSTTSTPTPRQKAARMAGTRASYSGDATRATPGHRERVLLEPSLGLPSDRVAERRARLVQTLVRIILLSLASITLVVAVTQAFRGRKPCARLCASAIAECIGPCRRAVADCRQSACASLSGRPARACRRGCRRPCKRECRTSILGACRLDGDRTSCRQPPSTTATTPTTITTTTTTTLADPTDWATGATRAGWPLTITSDPAHEHVWSAITLAGGALYVETASYCDFTPYYGRVVKIALPTPSVVATWYVTSSPGAGPGGGGIWGWGGASVDSSGDLYVATGNATTTP